MAASKAYTSVALIFIGVSISGYFGYSAADEVLEYPSPPPPFPAPVYGGPRSSPSPSVVLDPLHANSILDVINSRSDLKIVALASAALNLSKTFEDIKFPFTAFLPSDDAFTKFAEGMGKTIEELSALSGAFLNIFQYHIVPEAIELGSMPASGERNTTVQTLLGSASYQQLSLLLDGANTSVRVRATNSIANVVAKDIVAGSSYVNVIDTVLEFWYPNLIQALHGTSNLNTLQQGLNDNGLISKLDAINGTYSLFAPNDQAFLNANTSLGYDFRVNPDTLAYHVVTPAISISSQTVSNSYQALNSKNLTVTSYNGSVKVSSFVKGRTPAQVIIGSIPFGGVLSPSFIHVVDKVLIPTYTNVFEYVSSEPSFSLLNSLLTSENNVIKTLNESRSAVTLLAPTNTAIAKFGSLYYNNVNLSAVISANDLTAVLKGSVVVKELTYESLNQSAALDTLLGAGTIIVSPTASGPLLQANVTNATTTQPRNTSILYGRSYVHAIDFVMLKNAPVDAPVVMGNSAAATIPSVLMLLMAVIASLIAL